MTLAMNFSYIPAWVHIYIPSLLFSAGWEVYDPCDDISCRSFIGTHSGFESGGSVSYDP